MSKRLLLIFISTMLAITLFPIISINALENSVWEPALIWSKYGDSTAIFSKDYDTAYSGEFSFRIQNLDYEDTCFSMVMPTEKNTIYKISAMVKYEGYELQPIDSGVGGANISIAEEFEASEVHNKSSWKQIELEFNSGEKTSVTILLRNGFYEGACKGTAWFSDVKIEKRDMTPSTEWNFLCLIFKNVDVTVNYNGKKDYHHKKSFTDDDISMMTSVLKRVPKSFSDISGKLMTVGNMDIFAIDTPITKVTGRFGSEYCMEPEDIQDTLDLYLSGKDYQYDQIIIIVPLNGIANDWYGLGGGRYKDVGFVQVTHESNKEMGLEVFPDAVFIHEVLHCIEYSIMETKDIAELHDCEKYGYTGENEWIEWYTDYMRNKLPDGKGLPKGAYNVYHGDFTTISTNMDSTSVKIIKDEPAAAIPTSSVLLVNGVEVKLDAYNINGNNYFKLRDLAYILKGTEKQFDVEWDGGKNAITLTSNKTYTTIGGEMSIKGTETIMAKPTKSKIYLDGKEVRFTAYEIKNSNYFKLRDIGETFNFNVSWDNATNTITINTHESYTAD